MSAMEDFVKRLRPAPKEVLATASTSVELQGRRDDLLRAFTEGQYDLGGVAYEMAIREHFRLDVLTRRAASLQVVDAELGEVERLLRMDETATSGTCRSCGAVHSRAATYCWQCGMSLLDSAAPAH